MLLVYITEGMAAELLIPKVSWVTSKKYRTIFFNIPLCVMYIASNFIFLL